MAIATEEPPEFRDAMTLIHSYGGSGDALDRAMQTADKLQVAYPESGFSEALRAEAASTFEVEQDGTPEDAAEMALSLANKAIEFNPDLPLAHIAKARVRLRQSHYDEANAEIATVRRLAPENESGVFLEAEVSRRQDSFAAAEKSYRRFIAMEKSPARKANGYYWLAKTFEVAASRGGPEHDGYISKANDAFKHMLAIGPHSAWGVVNYAIFLNDAGMDYVAAERYAKEALSIMPFPMARYHLAIARYQQLLAGLAAMDDGELKLKVDAIEASTGISLNDAIDFDGNSTRIFERMQPLRDRLFMAKARQAH